MTSIRADIKVGAQGEGEGFRLLELPDDVVAERTIPRGRDAADTDRAPGVDPGVWRLHVRYDRHRDRATLAALVDEYDRYARSLAWRFHRQREPSEDLEQVAREALVLALQRFDVDRGVPFPAFATPTITGALRRHYRDRGWSVRVPRRVHEVTVAARAVSERLTADWGRTPTIGEVAEVMAITVEDLLDAQEAVHARETASLDTSSGQEDTALGERLGHLDSALTYVEDHLALARAMAELQTSERDLIALYYFDELNQSQIGERLGISQMQVSRRLSATLGRLRSQMMPVPHGTA